MELSPEEYGAYWRASIRITAGFVIVLVGLRIASPLLGHANAGAMALGAFLLLALAFAGTFVATLGAARVIRTAVDAEMRG